MRHQNHYGPIGDPARTARGDRKPVAGRRPAVTARGRDALNESRRKNPPAR